MSRWKIVINESKSCTTDALIGNVDEDISWSQVKIKVEESLRICINVFSLCVG